MSPLFEELDYRPTPMGDLSLRRRREPRFDVTIEEIKLGEEFLMSSLFTDGEIALAELALAAHGGTGMDVAVGGLGLGYTALAALQRPCTGALLVIEAAQAVLDWHRDGLLPLGPQLCADPRCRLVQGDFFARAAGLDGLDPQDPARRFDAILLDIDHAPGFVLHPGHRGFYSAAGLRRLARHLRPGGIFALWSNEPPDPGFGDTLAGAFAWTRAERVPVRDPHGGIAGQNTIYLAREPVGA
ncbi:MAG: hypothetical protein RLO22_21200 [Sneathiellaceae bacterium]